MISINKDSMKMKKYKEHMTEELSNNILVKEHLVTFDIYIFNSFYYLNLLFVIKTI